MSFSFRALIDRFRPSHPTVLERIVEGCILVMVFCLPLFVLPMTLDVLELSKQTLLIVFVLIALLAWFGQMVQSRRVRLAWSWVNAVVLCLVIGFGLASISSQDRYLSLVGSFGQMQWSFSTIVALALFFLVFTNSLRDHEKLHRAVLVFLGSSFVVGVFGCLQLMHIPVFAWLGDVGREQNFSTIGTLYALSVYMTVPLIIATAMTIHGFGGMAMSGATTKARGVLSQVVVWGTLLTSVCIAVLADYWVVWAGILFGNAVILSVSFWHTRRFQHAAKLILPGILGCLAVALLIFPTPIKVTLPGEVSPSMASSWNIVRQTLETRPLFGSGPGTWIFDYAKFRAPSVNMSPFWTVRFDHARSAFLTLLATTGLIGTSLWLLLIVSGMVKGLRKLGSERDEQRWRLFVMVFSGWITSSFLLFLYTQNISHQFVFWFLFSAVIALSTEQREVLNGEKKPWVVPLLTVKLIVLGIASVCALWVVGQRVLAESAYTQAVHMFRDKKLVQPSIEALVRASTLNPYSDTYMRNLSQAYLVKASQEFATTPDSDRAKKVNASVALAVDATKKAVELSPANVENWANSALIFQSIASFTRGADEQAMAFYGQAIAREPNNPSFSNEIGKIHILRSDAYRQLLESSDVKVRKDAEESMKSELDSAAEALNQSIQMKPDFAPAHYNLGLVYERQGRLKDAIRKLEQVLTSEPKNVGVAFQLGILYYRHGQKDSALNVFEQIVAFDPTYANARWYLAVLYEERGRYDDAIGQVQQVLTLNPGNAQVENRLRLLKEARDAKAKPVVAPLPEPVQEQVDSPKPANVGTKP